MKTIPYHGEKYVLTYREKHQDNVMINIFNSKRKVLYNKIQIKQKQILIQKKQYKLQTI